jgi:hypothetical protein
MLNPFRCIPGIVLGLAAVFSTEAADHGKALSVCDVIGNLPSFRDRVVVIQGEYVGGPEQSYITERACPRSFTTFGYTWPNSLKLAAPARWILLGRYPLTRMLVAFRTSLALSMRRRPRER